MKTFTKSLALLGMMLLSAGLWSCSDSNDDPGAKEPAIVVGVEEPTDADISATSVNFKLKTKGAESFVVKVLKGTEVEEPNASIAYKEAEEAGTVIAVDGNTATYTVNGMEGKETYTVFFIFKTEEGYKIEKVVVTTGDYKQMVTILNTDMFSVTFHVEVPEDTYYMLNFNNYENYYTFQQYGQQDVDWTQYDNNGMYGMPKPYFKGPQTITLERGQFQYEGAVNEDVVREMMGEEGVSETVWDIRPGTGYVLFISQCDENGCSPKYTTVHDQGGGDWGELLTASALPNVKDYTEEPPTSERMDFTGLYAKTVFFSEQARLGDGEVKIEIEKLTERSAILTFKPSENVIDYAIAMYADDALPLLYEQMGGEDGMQAITFSYNEHTSGNQRVGFNLVPGATHTAFVVARYDEKGEVQTFHKLEGVKTIISDKPAVEIAARPLTADEYKAEGKDPAFNIGWNIKAPNKDCFAMKYLLNYYDEWILKINELKAQGVGEEAAIQQMISMYGQGIVDEETLAKINSNEGFNIIFSSMDHTKSWLVLETYNEDEKTKLIWDDANLIATSGDIAAEEFVGGELYDALQGEWTATLTPKTGAAQTAAVAIGVGPEVVNQLPAEDRQALVDYYMTEMDKTEAEANQLVDQYFAEYQELTTYYNEKYKKQNFLVATGFEIKNDLMKWASPLDLFTATSGYNSVSTEECFRDYGPKVFFKFYKEGDVLKVKVPISKATEEGDTYASFVDPVASWQSRQVDLFGINGSKRTSVEFNVKVSDDKNTLTLEPVDVDGKLNTPNFAYQMSPGMPYYQNIFVGAEQDAIVLTRNAAPAAMKAVSRTSNELPAFKMSVKASDNRYRRTRTMFDFEYQKPLELPVVTVDMLKNKK